VFAWTSPTVYVTIGVVPISMYVETPVSLSLDVSLTSTATVSSSLYASVTMKSGYRYSVYSSPNLQQISENSMVYGGTGLTFENLCDATATAQFAVNPMAQLVVSFVGGPVRMCNMVHTLVCHICCIIYKIHILFACDNIHYNSNDNITAGSL
jgi:hypothetical protein